MSTFTFPFIAEIFLFNFRIFISQITAIKFKFWLRLVFILTIREANTNILLNAYLL